MKLEKYCAKFGKCVTISGNRSAYYDINGIKIRLSDHISRCTDAFIQIIEKGDKFVISRVCNGEIDICTLQQAQEYIRLIAKFPGLFVLEKSATVLGIPFSSLTPGQRQSVKMAIKNVK